MTKTAGGAEFRWVDETLHDDVGLRMRFRIDKMILDTKTEYQHMQFFETKGLGKILVLDGATQLTTWDEFVYHEMMAHVPVMAHGSAENVLIIGGGDGGIAEEVLKHDTVKRLTMVEIDEAVIDFAREHLPEVHGNAFDDPRFNLVIGDGMKHVQETSQRYDVIIVDSTDPIGPAKVLFTEEFYGACSERLTDSGILVTQNGNPLLQPGELLDSVKAFNKHFIDAGCYVCAMPTYVGGFFACGWATHDLENRRVSLDLLEDRYEAGKIKTRYYAPEVHKAAFALPPYIRKLAV